jgi:hypothetical protein
MRWVIDKLWDGRAAEPGEIATVEALFRNADLLIVTIDAPRHGDPPPPATMPLGPGAAEGLWHYEVVELFIAGADGRYLELEVGPWGHSLALAFSAPRMRTALGAGLASATMTAHPTVGRWHAIIGVPSILLPPAPHAANACAIHGAASARRHLSATPLPGPHPDFHQPGRFAPCALGPTAVRASR